MDIIKKNPTTIGNTGEMIALAFLKTKGMHLIEHQYRTQMGEIDLIMKHNNDIVFVEVRYRKNIEYGDPEITVDYYKQKKLIRTAQLYNLQNKWTDAFNLRFDVIGISGNQLNHKIEWIENAFWVGY